MKDPRPAIRNYSMELHMAASFEEIDRHMEGRRPLPFSFLIAAGIVQDIKWTLAGLVCRLRGHDLEDDSHAGPESGSVSLRCRRCAFTHHQWLY